MLLKLVLYCIWIDITLSFLLNKYFYPYYQSKSLLSLHQHQNQYLSRLRSLLSSYQYKIYLSNKNNDEFNWDPKLGPKLDFSEDYYSVLEVNPPPANIDSKILKKAYYKMVFKYHPDNKEGDDAKSLCNKQMMVINAAYKILKNDKLRNSYNIKRSMGFYGAQANIKETKENDNETKQDDMKEKTSSSNSNYKSKSSQNTKSNNYNYNANSNSYNYNDNYKGVESMVDVLSDLWSDIRDTGGTNIFEDVLDFLEDKLDSENFYSTKSSSSSSSSSSSNKEEINSEISMINMTIKNLKLHATNLMKECQVKEFNLKSTKGITMKTVEEMENRFRQIEDLKSLQARVNEVEKQIKQLERQLSKKKNSKTNTNFSSNNNNNNNNNSKYDDNYDRNSQSRYSEDAYSKTSKISNENQVEIELQLLKKKLGIEKK